MEVVTGKADAFVYDLPFCVVFMAQQGKTGQLVFLDKPFTYEPLAWAVRKGDPDFLNWLNNFLAQMRMTAVTTASTKSGSRRPTGSGRQAIKKGATFRRRLFF